eukprot:CAMPEP_0116024692 /NCGR_PEP_ID=MMETSP0321-20121206/12496_1 /TAXON_ID=163516 /ORGANISM="Leptocylindrus danicus var. danicus, Strain B650" /LENGTH=158 /DNA_ID=CAMNT_0003496527 /DNA_START=47 /DNA_END=521 /DNA_ORIENTATION=-
MKSSLSLTLFLVFALLALSSVLADDAGKRKKSLRATNRDIEVEDELEQMIPGLSRDLHEVEDDEDEDEEDEEDEDEEDGYGESNSLDLPEGDEYDEYEPEGYYRRGTGMGATGATVAVVGAVAITVVMAVVTGADTGADTGVVATGDTGNKLQRAYSW